MLQDLKWKGSKSGFKNVSIRKNKQAHGLVDDTEPTFVPMNPDGQLQTNVVEPPCQNVPAGVLQTEFDPHCVEQSETETEG